jgi:hypothetical protein
LEDGHCGDCQPYEHPVGVEEDGIMVAKTCMQGPCDLSTQIYTLPGRCKTCDPYFHPDIENMNCI